MSILVKGTWLGFGLALGLVACAGGRAEKPRTPGQRPAAELTAARIYTTAEELARQQRYAEAVLLVRHAVLQLPEAAEADALRHKLILRMAYLQMLATDQTGDRAHAADAERMLNRYLAKHAEIFGDGEEAQTQRGEVYEILYEVETLLEEPEPGEAELIAQAEAEVALAPRPEPEAAPDREPPTDTHAGEVLEDYMEREVHVEKKRRLADPDDPRVRPRLESDFSDAETGPFLTLPGVTMIHGPRGLVRARGLVSAVDEAPADERREARRLGRELLVNARPDLRRCYEAAFARTTVTVATGTVEASIRPDGTVTRARIVEGGLVDGLGDVCLLQHIEGTRVAADTTRSETRVRIPLTFFHQSAVYIDEATGATFNVSTGNEVKKAKPSIPSPMQPIDQFKK